MDIKRLILFSIFSFSILTLWESWQKHEHPTAQNPAQIVATDNSIPNPATSVEGIPAAKISPVSEKGFNLVQGQRIKVSTDIFLAEIDTMGADLRHVELLKHRDSNDTNKNLVLMDDHSLDAVYLTQSGLLSNDLPNHKASYQASASSYSMMDGQNKLEVKLTWAGDNGVTVDKVFTFQRDSYVINVRYDIHNGSAAAITPSVYYQIVHDSESNKASRMMPTFTGAAYYTEADKYKKIAFADMAKTNLSKTANDGWIGLVQHYFVSAWLPKDGISREYFTKQLTDKIYAMGAVSNLGSVAAGATTSIDSRIYIGPQEQTQLKQVAPGLEYTVDYGWLKVIASPLFWVLSHVEMLVHNWGVAIIILTFMLKLAFYPLSAAGYKSMAKMRELAPRMQKMKEQYGDDRQKMQQAMMELYKTEKINPMGGCFPIIVQIPVFIAFYWMLLGTVELRHAPFALWIHDLSAPDPYYVLPVLMAISMFIQTKLNPTPPDPLQAKMMMFMPLVFSVFFFFFPAGLVLYWLFNNILSIAQQARINHVMEGSTSIKKKSH